MAEEAPRLADTLPTPDVQSVMMLQLLRLEPGRSCIAALPGGVVVFSEANPEGSR